MPPEAVRQAAGPDPATARGWSKSVTAEFQRTEKTLEDAGIKLDVVASDIMTVSGRIMLKALVAGERDPEVLAEHAKGVMRKKIPQLKEALRGRFKDHHALMVGMALEHAEYLERQIARHKNRRPLRHPGQRDRRPFR